MVLVAAEKNRRAIFPPHGQAQGECHKLGFTGFGGESKAKLGDVVNVEIDAIKSITDVNFQELDRTKGGVGQDDPTQDLTEVMSKLHGL